MPSARKKIRHGTTADLMVALGKRYNTRAYAMLSNVAEGTGYAGTSGFADAIAVSLWPSRGLEIIGHELKASRSDWLREYKKPEKNSGFIPYCHRWWLVVSGPGIVRGDELPPAWGLLQLKGKVLHEITPAPAKEPKPLELSFFCALIRRVADGMCTVEEKNAAVKEAKAEGFEEGKASLVKPVGDHRTYREAFEKLRDDIAAFEKASGLPWFGSYHRDNAARIGLMAKLLSNHHEYSSWADHVRNRQEAAQDEVETWGKLLKKFTDLEKVLPQAPDIDYRGPSFEEMMGDVVPRAGEDE